MDDFIKNIEKTRNTSQQYDYYGQLAEFIEQVEMSQLNKISAFPVFTPRQLITYFIERYEMFKLCLDVPGSIIECGVGSGFGLMTFAHLASIFEPYHYARHVIGFDTFSGFTGISEKDKSSHADHLRNGGLNYGSYEMLNKAVELYNMNRVLGHLHKVELVKGDICLTLPKYVKENPSLVVSLLYLDVDLYKPTLDALRILLPRMPRGGVIAFDELNHSDYPGETLAAIEAVGLGKLRLKRLAISSVASYAILD